MLRVEAGRVPSTESREQKKAQVRGQGGLRHVGRVQRVLGRQNVFAVVLGERFWRYLREERFFARKRERCGSGDSRLAEEDAEPPFRDSGAGVN